MKKLYEKSEIGFAILFIVIYVVGSSLADGLSEAVGLMKSVTLIFEFALAAVLISFIRRNGLKDHYGLKRGKVPAKNFLYYIPLAVIALVNVWLGAGMRYTTGETIIYVLCMLLVGFSEEVIFRGLLFKAMSRDNLRTAIIVSSITFGIGHIINLFNGSGAELVSNLLQVVYAVAIGFLFVTIFHRGGSLFPCIIAHGVLNALSAFSTEKAEAHEIAISLILAAIAIIYTLILTKTLPQAGQKT